MDLGPIIEPAGRAPAELDVLAVRYGTLTSTKSQLFHRYDSYGEPDAEQRMDYFFWLLTTPGRVVVVDTGFDPEVGVRRGRTCVCPPDEALRRLGIEPALVTDVVVTHCHYDHIGNLGIFPSAELVVAERELAFWTSRWARYRQFWEHAEESEIDHLRVAHREGRVRTLDGSIELLPGVRVVPVGGHCPGQLVVAVDKPNHPVVLASDAVHLYEELELDRPFSVIADLEQMYRTFAALKSAAADTGAVIVPGHDPGVTTRFPGLTGEASGLAYRLC